MVATVEAGSDGGILGVFRIELISKEKRGKLPPVPPASSVASSLLWPLQVSLRLRLVLLLRQPLHVARIIPMLLGSSRPPLLSGVMWSTTQFRANTLQVGTG